MGFPDIPLEVNKDLRLDSLVFFVHGNGFDVDGSVKVLDFIVVSVESVVIFLGVELDDGGCRVFPEFCRENLDAFQDEEPFNQFLNVLLGDFKIQIVHVTLIYVIVLDHFFYLSTV
jgi:hypothetical protein